MIITIGGKPGSGKSTLAKMLAEKLGYQHYSMGQLRREIARQNAMTIEELNRVGETDPWTDHKADERLQSLGRTEDNFVVDSRTAFHFIPDSLKIFIDVDENIGAERIFGDVQKNPTERNEGKRLHSAQAVLESNKNRAQSDRKRYKQYYSIDYLDLSNYDFTLDTSRLTITQAFENLHQFVQGRLH